MVGEYWDYNGNELTEGFYHGTRGIKDLGYVTKNGDEWSCESVDGSSFILNPMGCRCLIPIPNPVEFREKLEEDAKRLTDEANDLERMGGFVQKFSKSGAVSS